MMDEVFAQPFEGGVTVQATERPEDELMLQRYLAAMEHSIRRQYAPETLEEECINARRGVLRASSLGKPAVLQLLALPHIQAELTERGYNLVEEEPDERRQLMFHLGDWFESWFEYYLYRQGYEIMVPPDGADQWEFDFNGALGHADIIARVPGTNTYYMVECKAMASYLVKMMMEDPWSEKPEYVTQASIYAHCFEEQVLREGVESGVVEDYKDLMVIPVIAALSLDERRVYYHYISPEMQQMAVTRAKLLLQVIPTIKDLESSVGVIKAPPGERIYYYKKPITNYLTLPKTMKWVDPAILSLFYDVTEESYKAGKYNKKAIVIGHVEEDGREVTHWRRLT